MIGSHEHGNELQ